MTCVLLDLRMTTGRSSEGISVGLVGPKQIHAIDLGCDKYGIKIECSLHTVMDQILTGMLIKSLR